VAIRSVLQGKTYLSMDVQANVVSGYLGGGNSSGATSVYDSLTHREREVLKLVAEGNSNKNTAEFLSLSVKTVEKHRSNLMSKLNLHNSSGLTTYAIENGLVVGCPALARVCGRPCKRAGLMSHVHMGERCPAWRR
jgi:DNA-binding NarL/FixJ family response regulator